MTTDIQEIAMEEVAPFSSQESQTEEEKEIPLQEGDRTQRLLEELCQSAKRQEESLRGQLKMARLCAAFLGGVLALVLAAGIWLAPQVKTLLGQAQSFLGDAQLVMEDLQKTSGSLSQVDFEATMENVDQLIAQSGSSVEGALKSVQQALSVIEGIDIQGLNRAIGDLQRAVKPLAELFGGR